MGSGTRLGSRIYTNSFSGKEREMAFPFYPKSYFGFTNKTQYSYNVYHQLAYNGSGFGSRGSKWFRINNVPIVFNPPNY